MVGILITILVVCLFVGLIYWVADVMPVPQPLNKFVKIGSMVVGCIIIAIALLSLGGYNVGLPIR